MKMKTNNLLIVAATIAMLLASCGKRDSRMLTIINEDGTCSREISYNVSEEGLMTKPDEPVRDENINFGTDWERTWSVTGEDSVRHPVPMTQKQLDSLKNAYPDQPIRYTVYLHAKRQFQSVSEMSDSLTRVIQMLFKAESKLDKHFKWFYTDYTFQETFSYPTLHSFPVPIEQFIGTDSASYWFTGQPDMTLGLNGAEQKELLDRIEPKVSQWLAVNFFAHVYQSIGEDYYDEVKNPPVSRERFLALRDSFFSVPAVLNINIDALDSGKQIINILRDFYHSDAYTPILQDNERLDSAIVNKYNGYKLLGMLNFPYDLVMPGKPIDSGIGIIDGDIIRYHLTGERLIPGTFTIAATSRVTNVWAFIVTLLIILLAVGSFFYRRK